MDPKSRGGRKTKKVLKKPVKKGIIFPGKKKKKIFKKQKNKPFSKDYWGAGLWCKIWKPALWV